MKSDDTDSSTVTSYPCTVLPSLSSSILPIQQASQKGSKQRVLHSDPRPARRECAFRRKGVDSRISRIQDTLKSFASGQRHRPHLTSKDQKSHLPFGKANSRALSQSQNEFLYNPCNPRPLLHVSFRAEVDSEGCFSNAKSYQAP